MAEKFFVLRILVPDFGLTKTLKIQPTDPIGSLSQQITKKILLPKGEESSYGLYLIVSEKAKLLNPNETVDKYNLSSSTILEFRKIKEDLSRKSTIFKFINKKDNPIKDQRLSSFANINTQVLNEMNTPDEKKEFDESELSKPVSNFGLRNYLAKFFETRTDQQKLIKKGVLKEEIHSEKIAPLSPKIIEQAILAVEAKGLETEGIYRVSGQKNPIRELATAFAKPDFSAAICQKYQIHEICGALKLYFRELLPPVITYEAFELLINLDIHDETEKSLTIQKILWAMPDIHRESYEKIVKHAAVVAQFEKANMMSYRNLAIVLGPGLMRPKVQPDPMSMVSQSETICDLTQFIFTHLDFIFSKPKDQNFISILSSGHHQNYYTLLQKFKTQHASDAVEGICQIIKDEEEFQIFDSFLNEKVSSNDLVSIILTLIPQLP